MQKIELRMMPSSLTVTDEGLCVEGLVNKTDSWSRTLGVAKRFKEKIKKGAFEKAIQANPRIDFLAEHDTRQLLATTENDSLTLWEDEEGLKMRAVICPTSYGKDIYELMKSNIVNNMSFGFRSISDKWKKLTDGTYERVIEKLELSEVSVVRNPAYPQSAIAARGLDIVEDVEIPDDIEVEERSNCNMDEEKKKEEQRAYASYLYGRTDVVNSAMNIVAECSSLSGYLMKYVGEDKDTATVLVSLQHAITMASKIINDEIQVLVDDFNKYDSELKSIQSDSEVLETNSLKTEDVEIEVRNEENVDEKPETTEEVVETKEVVEEKVETDETEKVEEVKTDENRSLDLSKYRNQIKERR